MLTKSQAFYDNIHKQALGYQNLFYLKKAQRITPTLYDGIVMSNKHDALLVIDDEETLILEEESRSKMSDKAKDPELRISNPTIEPSKLPPPVKVEVPCELPKVSLVNESLKKLKFHIVQFDSVVKKRTTLETTLESARIEELLLENDLLLHQIMSQDVVLTVMNYISLNVESVNMGMQRSASCDKCFSLVAELSKSKNAYKDLLKNYSQLEKHCISLEATIQLNQEFFQNDKPCDNQDTLEILKYFENNELKAQLQDKDTAICKLKDTIKSLRKNNKEENVNHNRCELETINEELENSVAKLLSENEHLCKEINHVKQVFKDQFDSIKKTRVRTKEQNDSLIDKLNLKSAENEDLKAQIQDKYLHKIPFSTTIVPNVNKIFDPLATSLLQNREFHLDYLKHSQEHAYILRGIVEQAKAKQPLDSVLDFACKHAKRLQEVLVYVQDTCPNAIKHSAKKIVVTPKNNVKKVRFTEPLTSSSNTKQVDSSKSSNSNTPVLSSTGLKCSTSKCESKPTCNKKNDRILQTPSWNMKNRVEVQPRKVHNKNRVVEPICDANVKHSLLNANFELVVQIVLWYLDSGCSKQMTGNRSHLMNFVSKFLGTVRFRNDQITRIMGYGDYQLGNVSISRVYYVEGLGHNLFSIGQFCDMDLEVAFQKNTCFIRNLEGVDLLL
ncbi:hypothetical protein Tco_0494625 [Tanacetum coccineum]